MQEEQALLWMEVLYYRMVGTVSIQALYWLLDWAVEHTRECLIM